MRASGVSSLQLLSAVGLAGFVLAVLMVLLGESLAPSLGAYAIEMRTRAMNDEIADANRTGDLAARRRSNRELAPAGRRSRLRRRRAAVRARPGAIAEGSRARRFGRPRCDESLGALELRRDVVRGGRRRRFAAERESNGGVRPEPGACSSCRSCAKTCSIRRRSCATSAISKRTAWTRIAISWRIGRDSRASCRWS